MKFDETVAYQLSRVATAHKNHLERRLGDIGIHGGQLSILFELWKQDDRRQVDLAKELGLAAPTVNKIINGLQDMNLVRRERVADDARSTRIFLTDRGRSLRREVEGQWLEIEEEILVELTETERLILFDLLTKLKHFYHGTDPD